MTWPDKRVFEGEFVNDKKHGRGKMKLPDDRIVEGIWKNGKFQKE